MDEKFLISWYFMLLAFFYTVGIAIYRVYFSRLSRFPGPKLAAATSWYEFYFQFFKRGRFTFEIARLHKIYGPIVRINPWELHIADQDFYPKLYVSGSVRQTNNSDMFARGVAFEGSHFLSTDHQVHRRRRKPLEPFFSRAGVTALEPMLWELAEKVVQKFVPGRPIRLDHAMLAFSGDVIGRICCDNPTNLIDGTDFSPDWYNLLHDVIKSLPLFMHFPFLIDIIRLIPTKVLNWFESRGRHYNNWKEMAEKHISEEFFRKQKTPGKAQTHQGKGKTLFQSLVNSDLAPEDMTIDRLGKEAQVILGAGTVTTARTIDFICFYVLTDSEIRRRLQEELNGAMAAYQIKRPSWAELEKLPYLQAIVKEGLRYGVMHRLPRVSPMTAIQFNEWTIPAGVPVAMSAYIQHTNAEVFDRPFEFHPERWLSNVSTSMQRNFVPFSKGSRNCIGMNLAYAELSIMLASLFGPRAPQMELYETDETDVTPAHDFMLPLPKLDSRGIRIIVL